MTGTSELASQLPFDRYPRRKSIYGICLHMPGRTIVKRAHALGVDPLEYIPAHYIARGQYGPAYVIGYSGQIIQVADEWDKTWHVGISKSDRTAFLNGSWKSRVSKKFLKMWQKRWPISCNPLDLFPGTSANSVYIGIEIIPLVFRSHLFRNQYGYSPHANDLWYTTMQHYAVAGLIKDIIERHSLPYKRNRAVLVHHEELNPLTRSNKSGGWDLGLLRTKPRIDMDLIESNI